MKKNIFAWGKYPKINAKIIQENFVENIANTICHLKKWIPQGNLRSYGDCALAETVISSKELNKILSFDKEKNEIKCQSGILFSEILEFIVPKGFFLPVTPGTKFISLGGAIASDVHGKNHHKEGSFSDYLISFKLIQADGKEVFCSKENNSDLFWQTCGGMGLTGFITEARFKLKKIESTFIQQEVTKAENLKELFGLFEKNKETTYTVAWIDCLAPKKKLGRGHFIAGEHLDATEKIKNSLQFPSQKKIAVPFEFPNFVLNGWTVKWFNRLFFHKQFSKVKNSVVSYEPFFYPLDAILEWNRIYGKKGFLQYQFVFPYEKSYDGMFEVLEEISNNKQGSFLAVLKLFGEQKNSLAFPIKGYTLALDFPITKNIFTFLDKLDEIVLKYDGRIYLTKDARTKKELIQKEFFEQNFGEKISSVQFERLTHVK
jgi:FAD/FMN-containing dehydrogenase